LSDSVIDAGCNPAGQAIAAADIPPIFMAGDPPWACAIARIVAGWKPQTKANCAYVCYPGSLDDEGIAGRKSWIPRGSVGCGGGRHGQCHPDRRFFWRWSSYCKLALDRATVAARSIPIDDLPLEHRAGEKPTVRKTLTVATRYW